MTRRAIAVDNADAVHESGMALLDQARDIIAAKGENAESMAEIGELLLGLSRSGVLDGLLALRPGGKRAAMDVIAWHEDGSILSLYAMEDWQSPPSDDVHWHNYWQILLVMEGSWPDSIWRQVEVEDGRAREVVLDRRETIAAGETQMLGPLEPHGWLAKDEKATAKATLLMWSSSPQGKPRIVLEPATGALSDDHGFLNPDPDKPDPDTSGPTAFSWNRF